MSNEDHEKEESLEFRWSTFFIWTGIFLTIFASFIALDLAYEDPLYEENQEVVPDIQDKDSFMDHFMVAIGELGESYGIILTCWLATNFLPYSESCYFIVSVATCLYINGILKILYHDPRPFFNTPAIEALKGSTSYGNPSGHGMYFTFPFPLLYILLFKNQIRYVLVSFLTFRQKKFILSSIFGILTVTIGGLALFGRVYLGVHSIDQVLYGMTLGLTLLFYFLFVFYKPMMTYIQRFTNKKGSKDEMIRHLGLNLAFILFLTIVGVVGYFINVTTHDDPQAWTVAIEAKCDKGKIELNNKFARKALRNILTPTGVFACISGIILYSYFCDTVVDKYKNDNIWKFLGRIGISFLLMLPFIPLALIPSSAPFVVILVFSEFLLGFILVILLYSLAKFLMVKGKMLEPAIPPRPVDEIEMRGESA